MSFRPLNNFIHINPVLPDKKIGHIVLAQSAQAQPTQGVVIAVGPGKLREDGTLSIMPGVNVGDVVMFTAGSLKAVKSTEGTVFLIEGETLLGVESNA